MKAQSSKILKAIIIFIIFILVIIITMVLNERLNKPTEDLDTNNELESNNDNREDDSDEYVNEDNLITINTSFSNIEEINTYYTIKNILNGYVENLTKLNVTEADLLLTSVPDMGMDNLLAKLKEDSAKILEGYFDTKFKEKYNISYKNINNLKAQLGDYHNVYVDTEDILQLKQNSKITLYYVKAKIISKDNLQRKDLKLIIATDNTNRTFKIYTIPYLNYLGYNDIENEKNINLGINSIEDEVYNIYINIEYDQEMYVKEVIDTYKNKLQYDRENSFNILEEQYRNLRFEDENDYNSYLENEYLRILNAKISKYKITNVPNLNLTQIVCIDAEEYYYIFNIEKPGTFTTQLDNYTVLSISDQEKYEEILPSKQCEKNINRFFSAINDKNYKFAYYVLKNSLKKSKFNTKNDFTKFVEENWFENNKIEKIQNTMKDITTYECIVTISDANNEKQENKRIKFTLTLKDGNDFEILFE